MVLLCNLQELALREGKDAEIYERIAALRARHAKKTSLLERLECAGLP
ncbi:MAG TPA: hypothetical protein VFQ38_24835 [Longimicrobiales bacterium]|nr:hypothetical protein [Longimicrobiales bacterium]